MVRVCVHTYIHTCVFAKVARLENGTKVCNTHTNNGTNVWNTHIHDGTNVCNMYIHTYIHTHTHTCIMSRMCAICATYIRIYTYVKNGTNMCNSHIHTYVHNSQKCAMRMYMCIDIHAYVHIHENGVQRVQFVRTYFNVCVCAYTNKHTYISVYSATNISIPT